MMPHADPEHAVPWIQAFLEHDFQWYFNLGVAASEHQALDPSFIEVPVTIAAGGFDVMTSMRDIVAFAEGSRTPWCVPHGTHMLRSSSRTWCWTWCTTSRKAGVWGTVEAADLSQPSGLIQHTWNAPKSASALADCHSVLDRQRCQLGIRHEVPAIPRLHQPTQHHVEAPKPPESTRSEPSQSST